MDTLNTDELILYLTNAGIEKNEAKKEISILANELKEKNPNKIKEIIEQRVKKRIPIQYLLGKAHFMDFEVKVNDHVLIPRPETELLVEETQKVLKEINKSHVNAIEIGTGSGIIPIALSKLIPDIAFIATDINSEIINLAEQNAINNQISKKINFKLCDLFSDQMEDLFKENDFDLIISNPPYVKEINLQKLSPEVYLYEPKIALCGSKENKSGLIYYERIIYLTKRYLTNKKSALIALEIDPPLVEALTNLLKTEGFNNFKFKKDYAKLDRYLFVYI